jgi:hypothetical protein
MQALVAVLQAPFWLHAWRALLALQQQPLDCLHSKTVGPPASFVGLVSDVLTKCSRASSKLG